MLAGRCVCVCVHLSAMLWSTKCITIGDSHCTFCQSHWWDQSLSEETHHLHLCLAPNLSGPQHIPRQIKPSVTSWECPLCPPPSCPSICITASARERMPSRSTGQTLSKSILQRGPYFSLSIHASCRGATSCPQGPPLFRDAHLVLKQIRFQSTTGFLKELCLSLGHF